MAGTQVAPRFDEETLARIDALVEALSKVTPGSKVDRGSLVRALVLEALPGAEARAKRLAGVAAKGGRT